MLNKLTSIRLNSDNLDDFYIGHIFKQTPQWTALEAIDNYNNLGGIEIFSNSEISFPLNENDLKFYNLLRENSKIKDPFNQRIENKAIISWNWANLTDLLTLVKGQKLIIDIETRDDFFSGRVENIDNKNVQLRELNSDFLLTNLISKINIEDIVSLSINAAMSNYINDWQKVSPNFSPESELVEIYFEYEVKDRQDNFLLGNVICESEKTLLVESINEEGMLDSYTLVNKKWIKQIKENKIRFYDYLIAQNKDKKVFNQNDLQVNKTNFSSIKDTIKFLTINSIITVDNIAYTNSNIGILKRVADNCFTIQNFDNYQLTYEDNFNYSNIASVDLASNDQYYYQVLI